MADQEEWQRYERLVARLIADQASTNLSVTPNARLLGKISGRSRQIDVLINARHDSGDARRVIVDAKKRKRKIDVKDVEAFLGLMQDVNATHGYLVSPNGHTKAAEKRAQTATSLCIVPLRHLDSFDPSTWPKCKKTGCNSGRVFWDGYPALTIKARRKNENKSEDTRHSEFVHYVGKCDRCGRFHVLCVTCKKMMSIPEDDPKDDGHQCDCRPPWFWLASIEPGENDTLSAEMHAVLGTMQIVTVNRRILR